LPISRAQLRASSHLSSLTKQQVRTSRRLYLHPGKRAARCSQPRRETSGLHRHTQRSNCSGERRAVSRDGCQGTVGVPRPTPVERLGGVACIGSSHRLTVSDRAFGFDRDLISTRLIVNRIEGNEG
jgi:hypothetical protein